jgi:hypothetical protein
MELYLYSLVGLYAMHGDKFTFCNTKSSGRIILRGIFRKWEGTVGTGWSGLRIGTGGGHL